MQRRKRVELEGKSLAAEPEEEGLRFTVEGPAAVLARIELELAEVVS